MMRTRTALLLALFTAVAMAEESEWTLLDRGIGEYRAGNLDRAERTLEGALRRNGACEDAYYYLGLIREKQGKPAEAVAFYGKIGPEATTSALAAARLGEIALRAGKPEEALKHLKAYAAARPGAQSHLRVAAVLLELERYDETAAALAEAEEFTKDDLDLHELWGRLHMQKERWREALERWDRILAVIPRDLSARHLKATCLLRLGRREAAVKEWETLLAAAPYHELALRAVVDACADDPTRVRQVETWRAHLAALEKHPPRVRRVAGDAGR